MKQGVKKILKISSLVLLFVFILIFVFFRSKDLIFGVKIRNVNLVDGAKVENNIVNITGNAKNATQVILDGREISVDQKGDFNETIALLSGYNIIEIKAVDKFGHSDEKIYKLIY
ncbi:MAG: hypothetical protein NTZ44_03390 [Candidatus Nomurabacteria bacterium]|nr:hypothetical protein [Candidatus Nomurabacteria bacterium]